MRKKLLAIVFAAALLVASAVPLFGGGSTLANHPPGPPDTTSICHVTPSGERVDLTLPHQAATKHLAKHVNDEPNVC